MNVISMVINMIGGLGLFLYGMKLMGDGLENAAGDKMKIFFEKITSNPIKGILTGAMVTAIIQSSSATTVMVIGFVNAGLMNLYQAAGVIMGANIGTTITTQIIAFKLESAIPIFIGIGTSIILFSKKDKIKDFGSIILGFGILFLGMNLMKETMVPLSESPVFSSLIVSLNGNLILGILVGMIMTAIIQSSSASTGILVALATTGKLPTSVAIPILFGNNIGTCVTALLSSIGTSKIAKKAALIHLFFNVIGTIIFIPAIPKLNDIVMYLNPDNITRQIANAHTFFNILNTIIMIPFIKCLVNLVNKLIPGEEQYEKLETKFIDERLLETPVIAVGQTVKELVRMGNKAKENLELSMKAFEKNDETLVNDVYKNEGLINLLEKDITSYLVKLSNTQLDSVQINIVASMFHVVKDIERIGDHAENIADLTSDVINKNIKFSKEAISQLNLLYTYALDALSKSIESFEKNDLKKAQSVMYVEERIDNLEEELRESNIKRLNKRICSANNSAIFLDILSNFERVGDHSTNIAEVVLNRLN